MSSFLEIHLQEEPFFLLPQKALYRPGSQQLILSDLHLGKATHFRKQGLPMPQQSMLRDFDLLTWLLKTWQPQSVLLLGDLFHSHYNREWLWFKSLLASHDHIQFVLAEGNHDILKDHHYDFDNLIKTPLIEEERFVFSHHPLKNDPRLNVCGHIHPGVRLFGRAKQSVSLPCFYHYQQTFILPAFGSLTGLKLMDVEEGVNYYLVLQDKVVKL